MNESRAAMRQILNVDGMPFFSPWQRGKRRTVEETGHHPILPSRGTTLVARTTPRQARDVKEVAPRLRQFDFALQLGDGVG